MHTYLQQRKYGLYFATNYKGITRTESWDQYSLDGALYGYDPKGDTNLVGVATSFHFLNPVSYITLFINPSWVNLYPPPDIYLMPININYETLPPVENTQLYVGLSYSYHSMTSSISEWGIFQNRKSSTYSMQINLFEMKRQVLASLFFKPLDSSPFFIFLYHSCGASNCPYIRLLVLSTTSLTLTHVESVWITIQKHFPLGISTFKNPLYKSIDLLFIPKIHENINIILTVDHTTAGEYVFNVLLENLFCTFTLEQNLDLYLRIVKYGFRLSSKDHIEVNTSLPFVDLFGNTLHLSRTIRL